VNDNDSTARLEQIVRNIAAAAKSVQLYPPSSPIPQQTIAAAVAALEEYLREEPVVSLRVGRTGFESRGSELSVGVAGVADLAATLREHGIAELDVLPGCSATDLSAFLDTVVLTPDEVRAAGGIGTALLTAGVESIRVTDVHLTVIEETEYEPDGDMDEFLRALATDPDKLAAWMAAASAGDPAAFAEGLEELAASCGSQGTSALAETLAKAFMAQESDGKDALIGLALDPGIVRDLAGGMFAHLADPDIAQSVAGGLFGENMLSLSNALVHLPLADRLQSVYDQVQAQLPQLGHNDKELTFLEHMLEVRSRTEPEVPLVEADERYRQVAEASRLSAEEIEAARQRTFGETASTPASGVRTMLSLLDQQRDFDLYCETLDNLAAMVPRLVRDGDLALAQRIVTELSARATRGNLAWPELEERFRCALADALSEQTMRTLVDTLVAHPEQTSHVSEFVRYAPDDATRGFVVQAVAHKETGVAIAEQLLGRRVVDILASMAATAQWYQLGAIVQRLAVEPDQRYAQVVRSALQRSDEQSRREAAAGVAASGSPTSAALLADLVRDESPEVAIVAIRALAKHRVHGGAELLARRLGDLDLDGKDFMIGREIIGALARIDEPAAADALHGLANRRALIKRGHFAEVQELVRQALSVKAGKGVAE